MLVLTLERIAYVLTNPYPSPFENLSNEQLENYKKKIIFFRDDDFNSQNNHNNLYRR